MKIIELRLEEAELKQQDPWWQSILLKVTRPRKTYDVEDVQ